MKITDFIWENKDKILIYSILIAIVIIIFGLVFFPEIFYDQWIWKYYWGPMVADAGPCITNPGLVELNLQDGTATFNGIVAKEGYTLVSEITYGILLIISLYGIYRLLKKLKIIVNWQFALALMPYILFGPVVRVLEDTVYFNEPYVFWFISPLIYLLIAVFAITFLVLGFYLKNYIKSPKITVNRVVFFGGMLLLVPSLVPIIQWMLGERWGTNKSADVNFVVFLVVLIIIFIIVGLVYLIAHLYNKRKEIKVYKNPLNLAMLVGHLVDGITSYISIKDPLMLGLTYSEKHPASNFLLEIWGPLFPIVKFVLIIVVIYVFDILYKEELKDHITLINLLKIGILILGFSPGLRDLLRVTMGV